MVGLSQWRSARVNLLRDEENRECQHHETRDDEHGDFERIDRHPALQSANNTRPASALAARSRCRSSSASLSHERSLDVPLIRGDARALNAGFATGNNSSLSHAAHANLYK